MRLGSELTYTPRELGVSNITVTGTPQNGSWFGVDGCNQLTLVGKYTRVAGTNLAFQLETTYDGGTTVNIIQVEDANSGAGLFNNFVHNDDNGASHNFVLNYPIHGGMGCNMRIGAITCTSGSSDTLTLTAHVAVVP